MNLALQHRVVQHRLVFGCDQVKQVTVWSKVKYVESARVYLACLHCTAFVLFHDKLRSCQLLALIVLVKSSHACSLVSQQHGAELISLHKNIVVIIQSNILF